MTRPPPAASPPWAPPTGVRPPSTRCRRSSPSTSPKPSGWTTAARGSPGPHLRRSAGPLPEGVKCYLFPTGDLVEVSLAAPLPEQEEPNHKVCHAQISSMQYRTPDGQEHTINRHGVHTAGPVRDWNGNWVDLPEDYYAETFTLDPAGWDTVELGLHHSLTLTTIPPLAPFLN